MFEYIQAGTGILFLSTLSLRRATQQKCGDGKPHVNFYPRSPCGERREYWVGGYGTANISIHALLAESDSSTPKLRLQPKDFYPRSPCGERHPANQAFLRTSLISIHALLAESDGNGRIDTCIATHFYPRSPCGERRRRSVKLFRQNYISIHALLAESDMILLH